MGLMKKVKNLRSKSHNLSLAHKVRTEGLQKTNIGGLSIGARVLAGKGNNENIKGDWHDSYKKTLNRVTGKEAGKQAEYEQKLQGEAINRQQQVEQLRLAETTSDIQKRKLLSKSGGRQSLMRTLG